jgi:sec-independent protein translocase protein TatA
MLDGLFANPLHWVILLVVVLIMFGPGKLPGVGSALGKSLREFKMAPTRRHPRRTPTKPPR